MDKEKINRIAHDWIKMSQSENDSDEYNRYFWSAEKLFNLVEKDPENAWKVIDEIRHNIASNEKVFWHLAASHLEDLLVKHGSLFIDRFEVLAKQDPEFRKLLHGVWRNQISEDIWKRIENIGIEKGSP